MSRFMRRIHLLALGVLVLAFGASPAVADIHSYPQIDVAPDGTAVVVWQFGVGDDLTVHVRKRHPDGTLDPAQRVTPVGTDGLDGRVAVDGNGVATLMWRKSIGGGATGVVQTRRLNADGTLGEIKDLSPAATVSRPDVAVSPAGIATFVWHEYDPTFDFNGENVVRARQRIGENDLGPVHTLGPFYEGTMPFDPQVATDPQGNATILWPEWDSWSHVLATRRLSSTGELNNARRLTTAGADTFSAQVVVAPSGRATLVWARSDGSNMRIETRWRDPSGSIGRRIQLSSAGQWATNPQAAVDQDGDVTFAWQRYDGADYRAQTRTMLANGTLSRVRTLSAAGEGASLPQVDVSPTGNGRIVWNRLNPWDKIVQTRGRAADDTIQPLVNLSRTGSHNIEQQIAADAAGNFYVVWNRQGSQPYLENPPLVQLRKISAAGVVGRTQNLN